MTRQQAWDLVCEFIANDSLRKHALAVEAAMRGSARLAGEDEERWGLVGLIHDFDWEIHPTLEGHPQKGADILRSRGVDEETVKAVLSHASHTGVPREAALERTLFAVDELCGFLIACALVRPNRTLQGLAASSVRKKLKQKAFAASVSREDIEVGARELGVDLGEHVDRLILILTPVERTLGLGITDAH